MQELSDEDTVMCAMQSAYLAGIVARATRRLIECHSLESFLCCVHKAMSDLNCSGFAQFQFGCEFRRIKFGKVSNLQKHAKKNRVVEINPQGQQTEFTYRSEFILLVMDASHRSARDGDILQDNVTVFAESMDAWLSHHSVLLQERIDAVAEKVSIVNNLNNFTQCLYRINEHLLESQRHVREDLLTQLFTAFPLMGLQADQENVILDIVNAAIDRENALLGSQIKQNIELRILIERAVKALAPELNNHPKNSDADDIALLN